MSKGIHVNKSKDSKEFIVRQYWYFDKGFMSHRSVCNCCHDIFMIGLEIKNIARANSAVLSDLLCAEVNSP